MNISIIGTGYVGLPTGIGFASLGHNVTCIDKDFNKINALIQKQITLYEEGLEELFNKTDVNFTTSIKDGISNADLIILAVGTPTDDKNGEADLTYIYEASKEIANCLPNKYIVLATKSTVPVGTGDEIEKIINNNNCDVISLPEFLREGKAVYDFFNPDRIVCGSNSEKANNLIAELYPVQNILFTDRRSAEVIKYASNAFLATKIHYINEMANFCEKVGANILDVAKGMGMDSRIGDKFLNPGIGYGGSCFPKDTLAINQLAKKIDVNMSLINTTIEGNNNRKYDIYKRIMKHVKDEKTSIAILGVAFKNDTDDCRQSPAIDIVKLLNKTCKNIHVYDPKALMNAKMILGIDGIFYHNKINMALLNADICVILTEWSEFKLLDLNNVYKIMGKKVLLDYRNMLNKEEAIKTGFIYEGVGR